MNEVTAILQAAGQGDRQAAQQLLPLVYDELRRLAAAKLANERAVTRWRPRRWCTKRICGWWAASVEA